MGLGSWLLEKRIVRLKRRVAYYNARAISLTERYAGVDYMAYQIANAAAKAAAAQAELTHLLQSVKVAAP